MSAISKLQKLYDAIPQFECKPNCGDCCGPVPFTKPEWQRIKLAKHKLGINCTDCAYLVDSKCSIYKDRPFLCRLFGATTDARMMCPHGCGPTNPLTPEQAASLTAKYRKLCGEADYLTSEPQ